ncbi:extracellular solute-binding protein [Blautia sp. AF13-16]|uniref:ABC transporter substrate-binding protein n=2 Tax=Lachnospiraceae TaxID=186803 RepID=UPI000CDB836C|nr:MULTISPECIES: extracellular solute-binding protein [Blautia]MCB4353738.1 extracellular solute-binding protein [Blautia sp. RD014232]POP39411.1 maltose-binding protein [Blautia producta]RHP82693.1 extracellular solute-binding protein [Blautia sp. OF01-4LB]RHS13877.1 extracellular solute-binding protein [Blautia sp. AF13-16]UBU24654.1 extracellular solute-binding protein [Blautia parvula]
MMKKTVSILLTTALAAGMLAGCGGNSSETKEEGSSAKKGDYDLTLYSINTTDPDFDDWLKNVEDATGLKINVIAAPTDSDTRQQKITTILSTGDSSVDIIEINDEMSASFKNSGWLEGLNDTVMTEDIRGEFPQGYLEDMITDKDGNIIGVPGYSGYLAFWVNQEIMDEVGIASIDTKEDFVKYMEAVSGDGRYGYGGSWEKTYVFNEIAQFVNMFGGDYFDWTNPANKEAIQFLHDMVQNGQTPIDQIADKYEQMNPKANDGKYGSWFMWGLGTDYEKADMLGADKIHMAMVPDFSGKGQRAIFTDSWSYVLNKASENKEAAVKFLEYMADEGGMEASYKAFDRYPARADVAAKVVPDTDPAKEMYSRYAEECNVAGRPMLPQTMEFITDMGTIYQSCMKDEITVDDFCKKAQELVDKYSK